MKRHKQFIGAIAMPFAVAAVMFLAGCGGGPDGGTPTSSLPNADTTAIVSGTIGSITVDSSLTGRQAAAVISDFSNFKVKARGVSGTITGNTYKVEGVPTDHNILIEISSGSILLKAYLPSVSAGKTSTKKVDLVTTAAAALWEQLGKPEATSVESLENEYSENAATARIADIVTAITSALADPTVAATLESGQSVLDCAAVKGELEDAQDAEDTTGPTIVSIYPNDGLTEIPSYLTTITLTFNEEMSSTVPTGITVVLEDDATGTVTIDDPTVSWGVQGKTLIIDHGTDLLGVGTLTATVTLTPRAIKDAAGNALSMPSSISNATVDGNDIAIKVAVNNAVPPTEIPSFTPGTWEVEEPVEHTAEEITEEDLTFVTTFAGGAVIADSGATYVGMETCADCHSDLVDTFSETNHGLAWEAKTSGAPANHFSKSCVYCHSVDGPQIPLWGDSGVDFTADKPTRSTELGAFGLIAADYSAIASFDDVPEALRGIQCENCHGPGSLHVDGDGDADYIVDGSQARVQATCAVCHDAPTHHIKNQEWRKSGHAVSHHGSSASCSPCHSGAGFIEYSNRLEEDPSVTIIDGLNSLGGYAYSNVSCAACHDPHENATEGQLRFPKEELCLKCHSSRGRGPEYSRGPHHNVQGSILNGSGGVDENGVVFWDDDLTPFVGNWEPGTQDAIGPTMGDTTCIDCHMYDASHTFKPSPEACAACHPDMDAEAAVGYKQALFAASFDPVKERFDLAAEDKASFTEDQLELYQMAQYNLTYVEDDGSEGFHNTPFILYLISVADGFLTELGY